MANDERMNKFADSRKPKEIRPEILITGESASQFLQPTAVCDYHRPNFSEKRNHNTTSPCSATRQRTSILTKIWIPFFLGLTAMSIQKVTFSVSLWKLSIVGEEMLSPPSTPQPMSKRHQKASGIFAVMTQNFMLSKEPTFLALLNHIQSRLTELHEGNDEEYKQQIALLEDERDRELLEVEAARGFALERVEREYEEEKRLAEKEFQVSLYKIPLSDL